MQIIIKNINKYLDVTENKLYDVIGYINEFDFYQIFDIIAAYNKAAIIFF